MLIHVRKFEKDSSINNYIINQIKFDKMKSLKSTHIDNRNGVIVNRNYTMWN